MIVTHAHLMGTVLTLVRTFETHSLLMVVAESHAALVGNGLSAHCET